MHILFHTPGALATIFFENKNSDGYRSDNISLPSITSIIKPDLTFADGYVDGYSTPMTKISTGLYSFKYIIPTGASSVGSYIINIAYIDSITHYPLQELYQIIVTSPFGFYSAAST